MNIELIKNGHVIEYNMYYYIEINYGIYLYLRLLKKYSLSCYYKYLYNCFKQNNSNNLKWCILNNKNKCTIQDIEIKNKLLVGQKYIPLVTFYNILRYGFSWDDSDEGFEYWRYKAVFFSEICNKHVNLCI